MGGRDTKNLFSERDVHRHTLTQLSRYLLVVIRYWAPHYNQPLSRCIPHFCEFFVYLVCQVSNKAAQTALEKRVVKFSPVVFDEAGPGNDDIHRDPTVILGEEHEFYPMVEDTGTDCRM